MFCFICKFWFKKELVKLFGYGVLIVITGSMEPTINIKEMIVIKEQKDYKVLDVVTYRDSKNSLVTHRIVSKVGDTIVTRGDNNTLSDDPIKLKNIEGKVVYHSAVLGEIFLYWIKPILLILILYLLINMVRDLIKVRRSANEEKN